MEGQKILIHRHSKVFASSLLEMSEYLVIQHKETVLCLTKQVIEPSLNAN